MSYARRPRCTECKAAFTYEWWQAVECTGWDASLRRPVRPCAGTATSDMGPTGRKPGRTRRARSRSRPCRSRRPPAGSRACAELGTPPDQPRFSLWQGPARRIGWLRRRRHVCWKRSMRGGSVSRGQTETLDEKHQRLLKGFVLRARRVEEVTLIRPASSPPTRGCSDHLGPDVRGVRVLPAGSVGWAAEGRPWRDGLRSAVVRMLPQEEASVWPGGVAPARRGYPRCRRACVVRGSPLRSPGVGPTVWRCS